MSLGAFAQGFGNGMNMGRQWKKWAEEDELKKVQAESFAKVDNPEAIEASGAYIKNEDGSYQIKPELMTKDAAPGLDTAFRPTTERDALRDYTRTAQSKGLMSGMDAMKLNREARQDELSELQLDSTKRQLATQKELDTLGKKHRETLQLIDKDPAFAARMAENFFNSDVGIGGQGEYAGRKVKAYQREDGNWAVTDLADGTRSAVVSPNDIRTYARDSYLQQVASTNPQIMMELAKRDDDKSYKQGVLERYDADRKSKESEGEKDRRSRERIAGMNAAAVAGRGVGEPRMTAEQSAQAQKFAAIYADPNATPQQREAARAGMIGLQMQVGLAAGKFPNLGPQVKESGVKLPDWAAKRLYEIDQAISREGSPIFFDGDLKALKKEREALLKSVRESMGLPAEQSDPQAVLNYQPRPSSGDYKAPSAKPEGLRGGSGEGAAFTLGSRGQALADYLASKQAEALEARRKDQEELMAWRAKQGLMAAR